MLVPVGIINERHEPPVYYGVERPFVDTVIVPTTWFDAGAGVHGELGRGWRYRAYVMSPLERRGSSRQRKGFAAAYQKGSDTNIGRPAVTGRLEYVGIAGLTAGASFWTGRSGFEFRPRFDVPVTLGEADVRYSRDRLELRGQFAQVAISNADLLNDAMGRAVGVDPNVAAHAARLLHRSRLPRDLRRVLRRRRRVRAVRELRHAVQDAQGLPSAERVRSRRARVRRHVLARP